MLFDRFVGFAALTFVECIHQELKNYSHLFPGGDEHAGQREALSLLQASKRLDLAKANDLPPLPPLPPLDPPLPASVDECPRLNMVRCGDEVDASGKFEAPWTQPGCWRSTPCMYSDKCIVAADDGKQYSCSCPFKNADGEQVYRKPVCSLKLGPLSNGDLKREASAPKKLGPLSNGASVRRRRRSSRRRRRRRISRRRRSIIHQPMPPPPPQPAPPPQPPPPPPTAASECPLENMIRCDEAGTLGKFEPPWIQAGCELSSPCGDEFVDACMVAANTGQTYSCACPYKENGKQVHVKPGCSLMIR